MLRVPVAINTPLRRHFDYRVPPELAPRIRPGMRLRVPFGRRSVIGIALDAPEPGEPQERDYRDVADCLDDDPIIGDELLATLRWAAAYYHHPIGEVVATALPAPLRAGRAAPPAEAVLSEERPGRPVALSDAQGAALERLGCDGFGVDLLQGVTGSGKTELYLEQARAALAADRQGLLLVPEIGLTPQLLARARDRLGGAVAGYHSGMTDRQRLDVWRRIRAGEALLAVGTRSAVWLPFTALGHVWVDEEHDASFKQQDGLRYSARDVAIVRARAHAAPVVLGSATPSLESLANVKQQRYGRVRLSDRIDSAAGAPIRVVDARNQRLRAGLTPELQSTVRKHLDDGGQALVFVNRRGYSPALLCRGCGWSAQCHSCDANMAWHKRRGRLLCHHCGAQRAVPENCPSCDAPELVPAGQGTERVEERLRKLFADVLPEDAIARVDSDAMQRAGSWDTLRDDIATGRARLLVGTQMLAKGHDFPGITLVGVVSVDQALFSSDLRASERLGQLVMQVAGRAGRGHMPGEVLLQTHLPEHPLLRTLLRDGYNAFAETLLTERAQMGMPPARPLALLRAESANATAAMDFLAAAAQALAPAGIDVLGPVPAPMARRAGRTRAQLWLQATTRARLQQGLAHHVEALERHPLARRVRWAVDVDPADTL